MPPLQKTEPDSLLKAVPVRAAQPQKQLKSVSDDGSKLDLKKAERASQLANYVLAQGEGSSQAAQAVIQLNGKKYTVWVSKEANRKPLMTISIEPEQALDGVITITDIGLDGRVNSGVLPASLNPAKKKENMTFSDNLAAAWGVKPEGLEHRVKFQALYDEAVGTLLKFYGSR